MNIHTADGTMITHTRRQFLKQASAASLGAIGLSAIAGADAAGTGRRSAGGNAADYARGIVFADENGNGRRDTGDRGIPGVLVSNGRDVVKTDSDGRYEIPVTDNTVLFVIKPRGWRLRLDEFNVPRFYYIHRPAGAPNDVLHFKGVDPTGPLPASIDFPLQRDADEPDAFDVVLNADPQPYFQSHLQWYRRDSVPQWIDSGAAFGLALGDLVGDDLDLFDGLIRANGVTGFPWYYCPGNHDIDFFSRTSRDAFAPYEKSFGPTHYAFQHGPIHFLVLNTVKWNGFAGHASDGRPVRNNYEGHLCEDQLAFIGNYLTHVPSTERVVIVSHIPLVSVLSGPRHTVPQTRQLMQMLSKHPLSNSFSGHTHLNDHLFIGPDHGFTPADGSKHHHYIAGTTSGSWYRGPDDELGIPFSTMRDGVPAGYAIASFDGPDYRVRFKANRRPDDFRLIVHCDDRIDRRQPAPPRVIVNAFDGCDGCAVRFRLRGQTAWQEMRQQPMTDPAYVALHRFNADNPIPNRTALPSPRVTDHMYAANIPGNVGEGTHVLEVEFIDLFGQRATAQRIVEVV
jgi:hypothetical protein